MFVPVSRPQFTLQGANIWHEWSQGVPLCLPVFGYPDIWFRIFLDFCPKQPQNWTYNFEIWYVTSLGPYLQFQLSGFSNFQISDIGFRIFSDLYRIFWIFVYYIHKIDSLNFCVWCPLAFKNSLRSISSTILIFEILDIRFWIFSDLWPQYSRFWILVCDILWSLPSNLNIGVSKHTIDPTYNSELWFYPDFYFFGIFNFSLNNIDHIIQMFQSVDCWPVSNKLANWPPLAPYWPPPHARRASCGRSGHASFLYRYTNKGSYDALLWYVVAFCFHGLYLWNYLI